MIAATSDADLHLFIEGPRVPSGRVNLADLARITGDLQTALNRIGRVLRGTPGKRAGGPERDIRALCALELVAIESGSVGLPMMLAERERPLPTEDFGVLALESLLDGLQAVQDERELPASWDTGVLEAVRDLGTGLGRETASILFTRRGRRGSRTVRYTEDIRHRLSARVPALPADRREFVGQLLMADFDRAHLRCRIDPPTGRSIECRFDEALEDVVLRHLRLQVRVTADAEVDEYDRVKYICIATLEPLDGPAWGSGDFWTAPGIAELQQEQAIQPVEDLRTLAAPTWASDEELEEFLDMVRRSRSAELA